MSVVSNETNKWNVELSEQEYYHLIPARLNDKDLLTDFEFLHHDDYVENKKGNEVKLSFFNNNCLWVLRYQVNGSILHLYCLDYSSEEEASQSFQDMLESITECYEDTDIVQHLNIDYSSKSIMATYYFKD